MKQRGVLYLASSVLAVAVLFYYSGAAAQVAMPNVIIGEVAWMGTASSSFAEWIELANTTNGDVTLDGWTIKAKGWSKAVNLVGLLKASDYYLLERTRDETVPGVTADLIYTGELKNIGDLLELRDSLGNLVDVVDASLGWPAGDSSTKATMERGSDLTWTTSTVPGGTPRTTNSTSPLVIVPTVEPVATTVPIAPPVVTPQPANVTPIELPKVVNIYPGELVINEFVSDPLEGEGEWVEIYWTSNKEIDLTGATIEDGSKTKTPLVGKLNTAERFSLVTSPKGALNNTGDIIILRDANGSILDQIVYGDWQGGQFNAPAPRDGLSLARRFDGVNTFNSLTDWVVTETPTKNLPNKITLTADDQAQIKPSNPKDLVVSEIMSHPLADESSGEFIELYNLSNESMSLLGWRMVLGSGQTFRFSASTTIAAHEYKVFWRGQTKLALANDSGSVKLLPPGSDKASFSASYRNGRAGQSFIKNNDGLWLWTEAPTPGSANKLSSINQPPVVEVYVTTPVVLGEQAVFDTSDTVDPEGASLDFLWQFGDGATSSEPSPLHLYKKVGSFRVKLIVSDQANKASKELLVKVEARLNGQTNNIEGTIKSGAVVINEIMPNPVGSDEAGEWIELKNNSAQDVNLQGYVIDDGNGGSSPFKFEEEYILKAHDFGLLERSETDIALNNNADEVRLLDSQGQLVDQTNYTQASEGGAWARTNDGKWGWTMVPTPGEENVVRIKNQISGIKVRAKAASSKAQNEQGDVGDSTTIQCVVTARPGVLATQYFYCENDRGWQIYNYKKDFPELEIDELIEVAGLVQRSSGNWRLKLSGKDAIKKIGTRRLEPQLLSLENVNDILVGKLIKVSGEVAKKTGANIYLDDGTGEGLIYLKRGSGLLASSFSDSEQVEVLGIVQNSSTGLRILPRERADIKRVKQVEENYGVVATGSGEWLSAPSRVKGYALAVGSGFFVLGGLWVMKRVGVKF